MLSTLDLKSNWFDLVYASQITWKKLVSKLPYQIKQSNESELVKFQNWRNNVEMNRVCVWVWGNCAHPKYLICPSMIPFIFQTSESRPTCLPCHNASLTPLWSNTSIFLTTVIFCHIFNDFKGVSDLQTCVDYFVIKFECLVIFWKTLRLTTLA